MKRFIKIGKLKQYLIIEIALFTLFIFFIKCIGILSAIDLNLSASSIISFCEEKTILPKKTGVLFFNFDTTKFFIS